MAENEDLGVGREPLLRPHYPHMLAEDNAVWSRFLEQNFELLQEVWYDVRVGKPVDVGAEASDMEKRIAAGLTRKRIDVVAISGGNYWVIEVKPRASMLALGQVLSYARMFALQYAVTGRVIPVIVCDSIDGDLTDEFSELGIMVLVNE